MEDEEFTFRETVKERSITARSARNRRSHCGKGGLARFASDYMSGKEIKKKKIVYDKAAFYAWAGIVNQAEDVEEVPKPKEKPTQEPAPAAEATPEPVVQEQTHTIAPRSGEMVFEGTPADICKSLVRLWGTEPVQVTVVFRRAGGYHG